MRKSMAVLLKRLLEKKLVAVIGGGKYELFRRQFVGRYSFPPALARNLFLFPTSSTAFYRFERGRWRCVYEHALSRSDKKKIRAAFALAFTETGYARPRRTYGAVIEDRKTQITFSALGQRAPIPLKEWWKRKNNVLRARLARRIQKKLRGFKVRVGGLTSIDVTEKGIDKAYGIRQIEKQLRVPRKDMLFVGDAIYPGGNDYAVVRAGVDYVKVGGPADTEKVIRALL